MKRIFTAFVSVMLLLLILTKVSLTAQTFSTVKQDPKANISIRNDALNGGDIVDATVTETAACITVGNGTTGVNYLPLNTYYGHSYTQQIFKADELVGIDDVVTSIAFQYIHATAQTKTNVEIWIGHTTDSTFASTSPSWIPITGLTPVFAGTLNLNNSGTDFWFEIPFDIGFTWNGTSNIVVTVVNNHGSYSGTGSTFNTHTTTDNKSLRAQVDGTTPYSFTAGGLPYVTSTPTGTATTARSNIKLCYGGPLPPTTAIKPVNLTASDVTATTAVLNWIERGTATQWNIEYGTTGFTQGTGTIINVTEHPYTLTGLSSSTTYQFYVQSVVGSDVSDWAGPASFTTPCAVFPMPFSENFSSTTYPPNCWKRLTGLASAAFDGTNPTATTSGWGRVTTGYGITNAHPKVNIYSTSCKYWLVTPTIAIEPNSVLMFDMALTAYNSGNAYTSIGSDDQFMVIISTDGGNTWLESNAIIWDATALALVSNTATGQTVDLSSYSGEIVIAFYAESTVTNGDYDFHIGNVYVIPEPSCMFPSSLASSNITATTADLSWVENGTATEWDIEYGPTGFTQGTGTIITATTNPYTLTGLSSSTTYDCYVKSICTESSQSIWSASCSFTTACGAFPMPFSENFSSTTYPPNCWKRFTGLASAAFDGTNPIATTSGWLRVTTGYGITNAHPKVNLYGTTCKYWLVTPTIAIEPNSVLMFDMAFTDYNNGDVPEAIGDDDKFMVIISTDGGNTWLESNATIWDAAALALVPNTATGQIVNLSSYSGEIVIAFYTESTITNGDNDFHIGNVQVIPAPSCMAPSSLAALNITTTTADLSWIENGTATEWNLEYGPTGFTQGTGTLVSGVTNPYTLTELSSSTIYDFYVQAVCGENNLSNWTGPATFTTAMCEASSMCDLVFNLYDDYGDGWNGAKINLVIDGISFASVTLSTGASATITLPVCQGTIVFSWAAGSFDDEISFEILTAWGDMLYNVTSPSAGVFLTYVNTCEAPSTVNVSGIVSQLDGGTAITGATLTFATTNGTETATTDATGAYSVELLQEYVYNITVTATGFNTITETYTAPTSATATKNFQMTAVPPIICPAPANLSALTDGSNIDLIWIAPADRDDVLLNETFNTGALPSGWLTIDADGDGYNWDATMGFAGHTGLCISTASYLNSLGPLTPNNYLITPMVDGATSVNYWINAQDAAFANDHYGVCASSTGTNASDFTVVFEETMTAKGTRHGARGTKDQGTWYERTVNLPAGTKYIAFRHFDCTDAYWLNLDDVTVYGGGGAPTVKVYNVYRDGVKIASNVEGEAYTDASLNDGTYCYKVTQVCGTAESNFSNEACATIAGAGSCITVGTGTTGAYTLPLNTFYGHSYSQQIFTADELVGIDDVVTSIAFQYIHATAQTKTNVEIWIGNTTESTFASTSSWIPITGLTQVFSGTLELNNSGTDFWFDIPFDFGFMWDGTSNIVVTVVNNHGSYSTSTNNTFYTHTTTGNKSLRAQVDGTTPYTFTAAGLPYVSAAVTGTLAAVRSNIKLCLGGNLPTVIKPINLTASDVTTTTAVLDWTERGTATQWNIEYGPTGFTQGTGTVINVTEHPYTLTGLSSSTTYNFYVQSVVGSEVSNWAGPASFTTPCGVFSMPFSENFSSATYPPNCWQRLTGLASAAFAGTNPIATTGGWLRVTTGNGITNAHPKVNIFSTTCKYWLVTPTIAIEPNSVLMFDMAVTAYGSGNPYAAIGADDQFMVIISTDGGNTWSESNATIWDAAALALVPNTATGQTIDLSSYSGEIVIAFYAESTVSNGDYDCHIGNVYVIPEPTCMFPSSLTASNITATTADLSWLENGTATEWEIEYGPTGFTQGTGTIITVTTNPYSLTELSPVTTYDCYVKSICSESDQSIWSSLCSFTTACAVFPMPFSENFSSATYPPNCWQRLTGLASAAFAGTNPIATTSGWGRVTTGYGITNAHPKVNIYSTTCKYWLVTPTIAIEPNSVLMFDMALTAYNSANAYTSIGDDDKFMVIISTDGGNTWSESNATIWDATALAFVPNTAAMQIVSLSSYSGDIVIAFYAESTVSNGDYDFHIGNVQVIPAPSCMAPSSLAVSNITTTTADLSWVENGTATTWNIEYGPTGFTQGSGTTISNVTTNPYFLSNLTATTSYDFYVQAVCGENDLSDWTGPATFTTAMCEASDMCDLVFNLYDSYGDGWNGGAINLTIDGINFASVTLSTGASATITLPVCQGTIVFSWTTGSYDAEITFEILTSWGEMLYNGTAAPSAGVFLTYVNTCEVPPTVNVSGIVSQLAGGTAINGATLTFTTTSGTETATTNATGAYSIELMQGYVYDIKVTATGFNTITETYTAPTSAATKNFQMTAPTISVAPTAVTITAPYMGTGTANVTVSNSGNGPLTWDMSTVYTDQTRAPWDLVATFSATAGGVQAVATDGNFIYLAAWGSNAFEKYDMDLNFVGGFNLAGVTGTRDLTYDGQYFYCGTAGSTLYCLDLANQTLVSSVSTAVSAIRHCSYDPVNDGFWVGDWATLSLIDRSGAILLTGPAPTSAYGSGYDNVSDGGPYLLLFCQPSSNAIVYRYNINNNVIESSPIFDFASLPGYNAAIAGGAFGGVYNGLYCFFGNVQQTPNLIGIYELGSAGWLSANPSNGTISAGSSETVVLTGDGNRDPGTYYATATFNSKNPNVGSVNVAITLIVEPANCGQPQNVAAVSNATDMDIDVTWNAVPDAISYKVYVNGSLAGTVTTNSYTYTGVEYDEEYCVYVIATCSLGDGIPSATVCADIIPAPTVCNPPTNLSALTNGSSINLTWSAPADRDDVLLNETFETGALPSGWLAIDADGDGHNWDAVTGFNLFVGHSGGQCISSSSYDNNVGPLTPNNYLITPMVNGATSVNYWVCSQDAAYAHEHYGVCASSTGTNASDFTVIFEETMTPKGAKYEGERGIRAQGAWYERTVNLPAGTKYIAFRHFNCTDAFWLNLDDVTVYGGGAPSVKVYNIYRDGVKIASNVSGEAYTDANLSNGTYCYKVTQVCGTGESVFSNESCATISGTSTCLPPTNLTADATLTGVDLAWDYPGGSPLTWSTAYANNAVGTGGAAEFDCAQRWTVSDLVGYSGKQITSIMFAPHQTTCTFTLKIWTGGSQAAGPAQEVYSQAVATFTPAQENTITLTTPYTIDASQELWVGYHCVATAGHPAGVDAGPAINGKGNMMYFDNAWTTLLELASSLNYNWAIQANVEDNTTFNVYRDGSSIATNLTTLTYSDNSVSVGNHCYTVTANCGTEESDPSNEACVEFFGPCNPTTLTSAQSNGNIVLTWTAVSGAVNYKVYYGSTLIKTTTDLTHTVNNPSIGTHCFTVVTVCAAGSSNPSNEACEEIININEISNVFNIYPNPANDKVTVEGQNIESIAIYNIIGQVMNNVKVVDEASKVINTSSFENGVYIFRINTIDGNSIQKRIIIAH